MRKWMIALGVASLFTAGSALAAPVTATLPTTCRPDGSQCTTAIPVTNPDGSNIGGGTTSDQTQAAPGADAAQARAVQGVTGGKPVAVNNAQVNGGTIATGVGASNPQTQRISVATDSGLAPAPQSYTLLSNASTSGTAISGVTGGGYQLAPSGTFGGATVSVQTTDDSGNAVTLASWTSAPASPICANVGQGSSLRAVVTGGSPSNLNLVAHGQGGVCTTGTIATTVADGADVALGSTGDNAWSGTGSGTIDAILKGSYGQQTSYSTAFNSFVTQEHNDLQAPTPAGTNPIGSVKPTDNGTVSFTSQSAVGNLFTQDTTGYQSIQLQLTGTWAGTVSLTESDDNSTYVANTAITAALGGTTSPTSNGTFCMPAHARYLRAAVTTYTSGTVTGVAMLSGKACPATVFLGTGANTIGNVQLSPSATNPSTGYSYFRFLSAASTNPTLIKSGIGKVFGGEIVSLITTAGANRFVKFYNKASAPVVGTDTPVITLTLTPGQRIDIDRVLTVYGAYFSTGIAIATTGAYGDTDTTAVGAGDLSITLLYL